MKKQDFPILQNHQELVYLDNAATTQKPKQVIQAIVDFYENSNANVHRGIHKLSMKATAAYEQAHKVVADFINADKQEIIFTSGTTEGINLIAQSLQPEINEGDEIILTEMEHHSNIVPWQELAKAKKAVLKYIPITADYKLDLQQAEKLISEKTKILAVTQMSNVLGTINPIKKLAELAHKVNAKIIVDAAQSVPHIKVDVKDLDCDFLAFSGHKLGAPTGIGVLYGKKELLQKLQPAKFGGGMIKEVEKQQSTWADLPEKFEAGTPNIAGAIGLMAAINYLNSIGMDKIVEHDNELTTYALEKLSEINNIKIINDNKNTTERGAVISFIVDNEHPHDTSERLDKENIAVRAGHHCCQILMKKLNIAGTTRVSFYVYNTKDDVDKLISALANNNTNNTEKETSNTVLEKLNTQTEDPELLKENLIDHYQNPRNFHELENYDFKIKEHNPLCGDVITLFVKFDENKEVAEEASFTGQGCAISQAASSILTENIKNKSFTELNNLTDKNLFNLLKIPISPARIKCALLSFRALKQGLSEVQQCH